MSKVCPACKIEKDLSEFGKDKQNSSGIACYCLDCKRKRGKKYYRNNSEKVILRTSKYAADNPKKYTEWRREWHIGHPEKVKEYGAMDAKRHPEKYRAKTNLRRARQLSAPGSGVTSEQWNSVLDFYGNKCLKCGSTEHITQDHIVPLIKGGAHDVSNIQPLCMSCNCHKQASTADYRFIADWT